LKGRIGLPLRVADCHCRLVRCWCPWVASGAAPGLRRSAEFPASRQSGICPWARHPGKQLAIGRAASATRWSLPRRD